MNEVTDPAASTTNPHAKIKRKIRDVAGKIAPPLDSDAILGVRQDNGTIILSPLRTLPTGEAFVREKYTTPSERRTLREYAGDLWRWEGNRYVVSEPRAMKAEIQSWMHNAMAVKNYRGDLSLIGFPSNNRTTDAAIEAVRNVVCISSDSPPPFFLDGRDDFAEDWIACKSCLFNHYSGKTADPTPELFNTTALDFDPDPLSPAPSRWLAFLGQLWPDDPQQVAALQEWMGYALTSDTSQQKALLIVGPTRSGKGTIGDVMEALAGSKNVEGQSTSGLGTQFGLSPLIGKSLNITADARFSGANVGIVAENLLTIIGQGSITIDRKNREPISVRLPTRFVFLSNEIPRFSDSSTALIKRFIILKLTRSFYGEEDHTLGAALKDELPGIFNWTIEGLRRLRKRGRFVMPDASRDLIQDAEDLSSPVSAFVRDKCEVGPDKWAWCDELYAAYRQWCDVNGRSAPPTNLFARDLKAAFSTIDTRQGKDVGSVRRFYDGIQLTSSSPFVPGGLYGS